MGRATMYFAAWATHVLTVFSARIKSGTLECNVRNALCPFHYVIDL